MRKKAKLRFFGHSISGQAPNIMCPIRTNRSRYIEIRTNRLRYVGCFDSFY